MNASLLCLITLGLVSPFVYCAIFSRRETWMRWGSVAATLLVIPLVLGVYLACLGTPLPAQVARLLPGRYPDHLQVLGAKVIVGGSITVLLDNGAKDPITLSFPFDKDMADQLQKAMDSDGGAMMEGEGFNPGSPSWNLKPQFLPVPPPPPLPPKFLSPQEPVNLDSKHT